MATLLMLEHFINLFGLCHGLCVPNRAGAICSCIIMLRAISFPSAWYPLYVVKLGRQLQYGIPALFLLLTVLEIEASYYDQESFWSLDGYILWFVHGIGRIVNTINQFYSVAKILPYVNAEYWEKVTQDFCFAFRGQRQVNFSYFYKIAQK